MKLSLYFRVPARIWLVLSIPVLPLGVGTIGYKAIGGPEWTWFDATFMSAITLTTVGYGETHPLNPAGRIFTIAFTFIGIFLLFYAATETIRSVVSGQLRDTLGREGVKHALEEIRDHIIVCGLGRMGRLICQEFEKQNARFVVIDRNESLLADWSGKSGLSLHGDATEDDVLKKAGVDRAKVLVAVLPSDADNLYITLSGRVLNPNLFIVARAEQESSEPKLRRVGANQVVSPYVIGGHRVAQAVLRPTVGHFLEQAGRLNASDYQIEEVIVARGTPLCGKTIRDANLGEGMGILVIAVREPKGEIVFNPSADMVIETGSVLVVVGQRERLNELEKLTGSGHKRP